MRPKILIVSLAYVPFVGGAELALRDITDRVTECDFDLITYRFDRRWPPEERIGNMRVFRVGFGSYSGSYYGRTLEKFLFIPLAFIKGFFLHRRNRYAVFWSLMASRASAPALFLKFCFPRVPFFLTIQEGDTPEYAHKRAGFLLRLWRLVFRYADRTQVISSYLRDFCVREGADKDRIDIIPNGVDVSLFSKIFSDDDKQTLLNQLGITKNAQVIVSASRLVPNKGIDVILKAQRHLQKDGLGVTLLLFGTGPEEDMLRRYADAHSLSVVFAGDIKHEELPRYFAVSDVFVRPSRSEGLGTAFLEAMAAGLPIIGTPVGGIVDFLEDGKTGLFVKPDNDEDCAQTLRTLLNDGALQRALGENGRRLIHEKYSWDLITRKFVDIFTTLRQSKKILLATGIFPPDIGGSALYSATIGIGFFNGAHLPYDLNILTYGIVEDADPWGRWPWTAKNSPKNDRKYIIYRRISKIWPKGFRHFIFFLWCFWYARNADIVLSADASMGGGLPAYLAARLAGKKFIVRVTGEYAWEQGQARFGVTDSLDVFQTKKYHRVIEVLRSLEHYLVMHADSVIAPSEYLKRIISGWGVSAQKIYVIYNAFSFSLELVKALTYTPQEARRELKLPLGEKIFVSVGRLVPWKGFIGLVSAFSDVVKLFPDALLFIIGDGPEQMHIIEKIKQLHLEKNIKLLGKMPQEQLGIHLQAADAFVLNTAYEGFSHQLVEVRALSTPIITTHVGGNSEIIRDREDGILVQYNDVSALAREMKVAERREITHEQLFENMKKVASQYGKEKMIDGLIGVFEKLFTHR